MAAIVNGKSNYNLKTVSSVDKLQNEVVNGKIEIENKFPNFNRPKYYRTAGAQYDNTSIEWLNENNYLIVGYSIAADGGAKLNKYQVLANLNKAKSGDVVLLHGNHPESSNSIALEEFLSHQKNIRFVWLSD